MGVDTQWQTMEQVFDFIQSYNLITPNDNVLVAVSGGADSMALLSLMVRLRDRGELKSLLCVHLNHQLRPDADQDEAFVMVRAEVLSVRYLCQQLDVKGYAKQYKRSIETAGRDCRLRVLSQLAHQQGCTVIATGHHKDDSAETLIQRLSRGTGFRGLCGIWPSRHQDGLRWIRPLLTVTRHEIQHYLTGQHFSWREDTTNRDRRFRRNVIRHDLLPKLQSESQQDLVDNLHNLSLISYRGYTEKILPYVQRLTASAISIHTGEVILKIPELRSESPLILGEVIRSVLSHLGCGEQSWTQKHYCAVITLITTPSSGGLSLPGQVHVLRHQHQLIFRVSRAIPLPVFPKTPVTLALPGQTSFGPYLMTTDYLTPSEYVAHQYRREKDPMIEVFDADRLTLPLTVRVKQPGDGFHPLNRSSMQKVSRFLNRARLPLNMREKTILICDAKTIIWVCPVRMSDHAKITSSTRKCVKIEVRSVKTDPETEGRFQRISEYP